MGPQTPWSRPRGDRHKWNLDALKAWEGFVRFVAAEEVAMSGYEFPGSGVTIWVEIETNKKIDKRFGDFDNHLKAIVDALRGVLYPDDSPDMVVGGACFIYAGPVCKTTIACYSA